MLSQFFQCDFKIKTNFSKTKQTKFLYDNANSVFLLAISEVAQRNVRQIYYQGNIVVFPLTSLATH